MAITVQYSCILLAILDQVCEERVLQYGEKEADMLKLDTFWSGKNGFGQGKVREF